MPSHEPHTFWSDFRRFFLRGLAILLPSVLTIWIIVQLFFFVEAQVAAPINSGIRGGVLVVIPYLPLNNQPEWYTVSDEEIHQFRATLAKQGTVDAQSLLKHSDDELKQELRLREFARFWDAHWYFRFIGLVVAIVLFYLAGVIFGGLFGRAIYQHLERWLTRIPLVKQVYPHVKQLVDLVLGERQMAFKKVVMVQYPSAGIWSLAFVTSTGMRSIAEHLGEEILTVFIPSTPTPFTGFTITVARSAAIDLPISVDEAFRFVLTGGVLVPERQAVLVGGAGGTIDPVLAAGGAAVRPGHSAGEDSQAAGQRGSARARQD